jgi:hypothetical protein
MNWNTDNLVLTNPPFQNIHHIIDAVLACRLVLTALAYNSQDGNNNNILKNFKLEKKFFYLWFAVDIIIAAILDGVFVVVFFN